MKFQIKIRRYLITRVDIQEGYDRGVNFRARYIDEIFESAKNRKDSRIQKTSNV